MDSIHREQKSVMLLDLEINNQFKFATEINTALSVAELELESISNQIADNLVNIKKQIGHGVGVKINMNLV